MAYTRYDNGELSDKPLYVLPAADDLPTTYNLYMGGDFGETILETNRPELPDVLVFGASCSTTPLTRCARWTCATIRTRPSGTILRIISRISSSAS